MNRYLTSLNPDHQPTQLTVRSSKWLLQLPRIILASCLILPLVFCVFFLLLAPFIYGWYLGFLFLGFYGVVAWLLFKAIRCLLVPKGRFLTRGKLELALAATADRHEAVHVLVKLAAINDRLGRRVIASYYRHAIANVSEPAVAEMGVPIPKAEVFRVSLDSKGAADGCFLPRFGWLTLTSFHLAHEADILCLEDLRVVIRLEDIRKVELNLTRFRTPFMTIEFVCEGQTRQIWLSPTTRFDGLVFGQYKRKLALWKLWIEEAVEQRKLSLKNLDVSL